MSWQLRICGLGPACVFKRIKALLSCCWDFALSSFWLSEKKRKQCRKTELRNSLRMVPETVSTVSTDSTYNFTEKMFWNWNCFSNLRVSEPKFKKMTWASGHGGGVDYEAAVLSRAGFQQGNFQHRTHSATLSIPVKRWVFAKQEWKYCIMQLKFAGFIKPAHIPKMYSRSHVSWHIQHTTKVLHRYVLGCDMIQSTYLTTCGMLQRRRWNWLKPWIMNQRPHRV